MERCQHACNDKAWRDAVGPRAKGAPRSAVGPSYETRRTGHCGANRSDTAGTDSIRAGLSEDAGRHHYDVVFALLEMWVVEFQGLQYARSKTLEHYVGPINKSQDKVVTARLFQV